MTPPSYFYYFPLSVFSYSSSCLFISFFMVQQEFPWATVPRRVSFPPFSLIQNNIDRICANYCLSKTQSFATAHAKLCNCPRKALHLPTQSFAFAIAMLCIRHRNALREKRLARKTITKTNTKTKMKTKTMINPLRRMEAEPCCQASALVL